MKSSFDDYNFSDNIKDALKKIKFSTPTLIQQKVIPLLRKKQNVIGVSATGSGKSHAFLLPILEGVDFSIQKPQAFIMAPTRELAGQLVNNLMIFNEFIPNLKVASLIGGTSMDEEKIIDAQIVVGTPGRLLDSITKRHVLKLDMIKYVVIDEADMIFDNKFIKDTDQVMSLLKDNVCFAVFSATITKTMHPFLKKYFENTKVIEIDNNVSNNVEHILIPSKEKDKFNTLLKLIKVIDPYLCLIFASKKEDVIDIALKLASLNIKCIQLHGDLSSRQRIKTLKRINNLEFKFVVASDIAARGIDIDGVSHVISYDLPRELEYYIHRSGRTGRYNYSGVSYVIYDKDEEKAIKSIERKGIVFKYFDFVANQLQESGYRVRENKEMKNDNYDKSHVSKVKKSKQKVKPNYKKKQKLAIEKIKRKEKQLEIKQRIRNQRKKRKKFSEDSTD